MWTGFDGAHAYSQDGFAARVAQLLPRPAWVKGITLHNTAGPTLKQWAESGPAHDARIANLQSYYEHELGWHAGPHLFISRHFINGFSDLSQPGVHSRCFNATHIGIEMVGDYNAEAFDSGDGALVRDQAVFALATLYRHFGLNPYDLKFHKECVVDQHDCPGKNVVKADVIARVTALMGYPQPAPPKAEPWEWAGWQKYPDPRLAWVQDSLNRLMPELPAIVVDGLNGPDTKNRVRAYQRFRGLHIDGIPGDLETIPAIKAALAAVKQKETT